MYWTMTIDHALHVNIIEYNQRKWNQEKEIKKRVILVEKMVEKKWHSRLYSLPTLTRNVVKSGRNGKIYNQTHIIE